MAFQPIENYGVVGNLRTAALVGMDSSIDFFFPDFDSPTVFAALLDPSHGGQFSVRPSMPDMQLRQMYIAETNILVSRFLSESAVAEVCDFMPLTSSAQKNELVRIVRVIRGDANFSMQCQPALKVAAHDLRHADDAEIGVVLQRVQTRARHTIPVLETGKTYRLNLNEKCRRAARVQAAPGFSKCDGQR